MKFLSNPNFFLCAGYKSNGIHLQGSNNSIQNIIVSGTEVCVQITGDGNRLEESTIYNATFGVVINSMGNSISNITGCNVKLGILLHGSSNTLSSIKFEKGSEFRGFQGLCLNSGACTDHNAIFNLTCAGYSRDKDDWGLVINSSNSTVKLSKCGPISLRGGSTTLTDVDCGSLIQVERGATCANLINCRGYRLCLPDFYFGVTKTNCKFTYEGNKTQWFICCLYFKF